MKTILLACLCFIGVEAMAQDGPPQGPPPKMDSATMHKMMVKRYQSSDLGLTDVQIDSVVSINQSLMQAMHEQKKQEKKDRKKEEEALNKEKLARLTDALGDEKLAAKVVEFDKKNRRPGPGGPGGGPGGDGDGQAPPPNND